MAKEDPISHVGTDLPQGNDNVNLLSSSSFEGLSVNDDQPEKFPSFTPTRKLSIKCKSLTDIAFSEGIQIQDLATVVERLRNEESPPSLEQAREKAREIEATKKEMHHKVRKASINLIRSRTASRASASGRPSMEAMERDPKE